MSHLLANVLVNLWLLNILNSIFSNDYFNKIFHISSTKLLARYTFSTLEYSLLTKKYLNVRVSILA